jgi:hypothetical protein
MEAALVLGFRRWRPKGPAAQATASLPVLFLSTPVHPVITLRAGQAAFRPHVAAETATRLASRWFMAGPFPKCFLQGIACLSYTQRGRWPTCAMATQRNTGVVALRHLTWGIDMNTTEKKLAAISREPILASHRSLNNLRVFRREYELHGSGPALAFKTMALLVVFAGVGAIAILEFAKSTAQHSSDAPPNVQMSQAPAPSQPGAAAGSIPHTAPVLHPAELNDSIVRNSDKPYSALDNTPTPVAPATAGSGEKRKPDHVRKLPPSPPSPSSSNTPAPVDEPVAAPVDAAPPSQPGPVPPSISEETRNPAPREREGSQEDAQ